ncbi:hypothetical protein D3C72_1054330 [compost metagenome]
MHRDQVSADQNVGQFIRQLVDGRSRSKDAQALSLKLLDDVARLADFAGQLIAPIGGGDLVVLIPLDLASDVGGAKGRVRGHVHRHSRSGHAHQRGGVIGHAASSWSRSRLVFGFALARGTASAMREPTQAFIFATDTALPICLIWSVFVPANS